jgi:hypothetical protein
VVKRGSQILVPDDYELQTLLINELHDSSTRDILGWRGLGPQLVECFGGSPWTRTSPSLFILA